MDGRMVIHNFFRGLASSLNIGSSPLYRYPYRTSAEAFQGDWKRIGKDITTVLDRLHEQR